VSQFEATCAAAAGQVLVAAPRAEAWAAPLAFLEANIGRGGS